MGTEVTHYTQGKDGDWTISGVVNGRKTTAHVSDEEFQYHRIVSANALHDLEAEGDQPHKLKKLSEQQAEEVFYDTCDRLLGRQEMWDRSPLTPNQMAHLTGRAPWQENPDKHEVPDDVKDWKIPPEHQ